MLRFQLACLALLIVFSADGFLPATTFAADTPLPAELQQLFERLDAFGKLQGEPLTLVELTLIVEGQSVRKRTEQAWLVQETDDFLLVRRFDLVPWKYGKKAPTTIPASWSPESWKVESAKRIPLEGIFEKWSVSERPDDDTGRARRLSEVPAAAERVMIAMTAWKHGLPKHCEPILAAGLDTRNYRGDFAKFRSELFDDFAWLHYLRGVNLLMYADRREAISHLRLAIELAPEGEHAVAAKELLSRLEKFAAKPQAQRAADESTLSDEQRARLYLAQLCELHCPQMGQPGLIEPYAGIIDGRLDENPPTVKLRQLGMKAVPQLIEALDDDTPTRTVYHWRDFARSRVVWRSSDFAWHILRDITKKEFGYQRVVGFTLGFMEPRERAVVVADIKQWYAANKDRSEDDRMFDFFASQEPADWLTAGEYFLAKKNPRAVAALVRLIPQAGDFSKGDLCELVGKFGDPSAAEALNEVLTSAPEHSDRMSAAIGLWSLGDRRGVPVAIAYVKAADPPYGGWEEPTWFLLRTGRSPEGIQALRSVVVEGPAERASEVLQFVTQSISGDLDSERREPAGCLEIAPLLIAAMDRDEPTGGASNNVETRIKDAAAKAFVLLRDGTDDPFPGRFLKVDPKQFDVDEPDASDRDRQIEALKSWWKQHDGFVQWNPAKKRMVPAKLTK